MNFYDLDKGNNFCVSANKPSNEEWVKIVDRVESAILTSLANKVLAKSVERQDRIDEHRRQLKLVELRSFFRKDSAG